MNQDILEQETSVKLSAGRKVIVFIKYFLIYLPIPMIGTLLHELGHYLVALSYGYNSQIHYAFCTYDNKGNYDPVAAFFITLGGPVATWMQSLVPFFIMAVYYRKEKRMQFKDDLPPLYIVLLCLSTFCSRFVFNAGKGLISNPGGDEAVIALALGLPAGLILYLFAFIATIMLFYMLYMIPKNFRLPLVFGAISGAILGYYIWYVHLGPLILP